MSDRSTGRQSYYLADLLTCVAADMFVFFEMQDNLFFSFITIQDEDIIISLSKE